MPFVIKTGYFDASPGEVREFSETPLYGGKNIHAGDDVYIWCCKTQGGEELSWRGIVQGEPVLQDGKINVTVQLQNQAPAHCFGVSNLQDTADNSPISGLARKFHTHSHRKIAELTEDEADLLRSHFPLAA